MDVGDELGALEVEHLDASVDVGTAALDEGRSDAAVGEQRLVGDEYPEL